MKQLDADPGLVASQASDMTETAADLALASSRLSDLAFGEAESVAITAMRKNLGDLGTALSNAQTRYALAADALTTYAVALRAAVDQVDQAFAAQGATDVGSAQHRYDSAQQHEVVTSLNPFASDSDKHDAQVAATHAQQHLHQELAAEGVAQDNYDRAIEVLEAAAAVAASEIELGIEMSHLNDSNADRLRAVISDLHNILKDVLRVLDRVLADLSTVLTIVGAVLLVLSLVFPALLPLAALAFEGGQLAGKLDVAVKAARYLDGDLPLGDLVISGLSFLVGATIGKGVANIGGRVAGKVISKALTEEADRGAKIATLEVESKAMSFMSEKVVGKVEDKIDEKVVEKLEKTGPVSRFIEFVDKMPSSARTMVAASMSNSVAPELAVPETIDVPGNNSDSYVAIPSSPVLCQVSTGGGGEGVQ